MKTLSHAAAFGCLILAGCGGETPGGNSAQTSTATPVRTSGGAVMPADFKATDACAVYPKAVIEQVLGVKVESADLSLVHEPNGAEAGTSECSYVLSEGRASVMTRWSPISDNSQGAIDTAKDAMNQTLKAFGGGQVEDVPGVGKATFWIDKVDQLQSFIGEDRMVLITVPDSPDAKDKAIALAKKAGA